MKVVKLFTVLVLIVMVLSLSGCVEQVDDTVVDETVPEETIPDATEDVTEDEAVNGDVLVLTEEELNMDLLPPLIGHVGDKKLVKWTIDPDLDDLELDSLETTYTSVRYGFEPVGDSELETVGYPMESEIFSGELPGDYQYTIEYTEPGNLYIRAYAVVNGENYWTEEYSVTIYNGVDE